MRFPKEERPILKGEAYKKLRRKACCRAGCQCEVCFAPTFEEEGHLHHINGRGMGGGKRDDSLEAVQWLCFNCHHAIHSPKVVPPKFGRGNKRSSGMDGAATRPSGLGEAGKPPLDVTRLHPLAVR